MADKFDWRMSRYDRMRATWADLMRKGHTKLTYAQFEQKMLNRDYAVKKAEFEKRKPLIVPSGSAIEKAIKNTRLEARRIERNRIIQGERFPYVFPENNDVLERQNKELQYAE